MKKVIEFDQNCDDCGGSGLYVGIAERDGAAVVCNRCDGRGWHHQRIEYYERRTIRVRRKDVTRVFQTNPGVVIGNGEDFQLSDFGGVPYGDWLRDGKFPPGSENRKFMCPAWWYQSADYRKKPKWNECGFGRFADCKHFISKDQCWVRWDKEHRGR